MIIKAPLRSEMELIDLASAKHKADPYPLYARLRDENPVCEIRMPQDRKAWLVTRYHDVVDVLKDERFAKDRHRVLTPQQSKQLPWLPPIFKPLFSNMLDSDPPRHTRLRSLVQLAFTPQRVERMRERIETLADELMDGIAGRRQFDLIREFALPLPAIVVAEMLGVPAKDRHRFHRWSNAIVLANGSTWDAIKGVPSVWQFLRYVRKLIRRRRHDPQDDLISALVAAQDEGGQLSEDELVAMVFLLLVAGHETTVNLIANGTLALLQHPEQLAQLRNNPTCIKPAVEELLRYASPLDTATERFAAEDVTIGNVTIPRGALVFPVLSSANRDEQVFARPNELELLREPNRHLSFGLGIHFCLGAALARMEGQVAINCLVQRNPGLRLTAPPRSLQWRRGLVLRGMKSLPVYRQ